MATTIVARKGVLVNLTRQIHPIMAAPVSASSEERSVCFAIYKAVGELLKRC